MYHFMVTCGRGLENFVMDEIREKVIEASNILLINEGKIRFCISPSKQLPLEPKMPLEKQKFGEIFKLKLIERLFLLLFFETSEEFQFNSSIEDNGVVEKICSAVNWKEATSQVHVLLSVFPPIHHNACICTPGKVIEDPTANLDYVPGCGGQRTKKRKRSLDCLANGEENLKMVQQPNPKENVFSQATLGTASFSNNDSAALLSSDSLSNHTDIPSTPNSHHSIDLQIRFRASCRITGKLKKLLNSKPFNESSRSFSYECSTPKDSSSKLITAEDGAVNFPTPCFTSTDVAYMKNIVQIGVDPELLEKCAKTDNEKLTEHNKLNIGKTAFRQVGVIDSKLMEEEKNQTLAVVDDGMVTDHPCGENHDTVCPASDVKGASDGRIRNARTEILSSLVRAVQQGTQCWSLDWSWPDVDVYLNITDLHVLLGVALHRTPLSLRPYIPHIGLRSTLSSLMVRLALKSSSKRQKSEPDLNNIGETNLVTGIGNHDVMPQSLNKKSKSFTLLDPMCGTGTLLAEAVNSFDVSHVIGCDVSTAQLQLAACNLGCSPASSHSSLLRADAAALPLRSEIVNAVVCDFPFGQQHRPYLARAGKTKGTPAVDTPSDQSMELLVLVLQECIRVVVVGGSVVLLLPASKEASFLRLQSERTRAPDGSSLQLLSSHHLAMGTSSGLLCVLQKVQ